MPPPANPNRKPHPRSWLKNLPETGAEAEAQGVSPECTQEVIYGWLREKNATLESVASRCLSEFAEFGCTQTLEGLKSSLSEWRPWFESRQKMTRLLNRKEAFMTARKKIYPEATAEQIAADGIEFLQATASEAEDTPTFLALEDRRLSAKIAATNAENERLKIEIKQYQVKQKDRDLSLVERRVSVLESNAAKAKAALEGVKKTDGISEETLKKIEEAAKLL